MATQLTLTGEQTDKQRVRPGTLLWCDKCEDTILRSEKVAHEHDMEDLMAYEKAELQNLDEKIPDHAKVETQQWMVEFHYTAVERVKVEASDKHDAKEAAELQRDYDGEIMETLHTDKRALGGPSPASLEWLEYHQLLPEDHDVSQEEIDKLVEQGGQ
jgi:hypothetical protein